MTASEWVDLGEVSTESGTFGLLDPAAYGLAADLLAEQADTGHEWVNFTDLTLPGGWQGILLATGGDGRWTVRGRFCPDGDSLALCAIQIELHGGPHAPQ